MSINDELITAAESILIGGNHFDEERRAFIRCLDSCDLLAVPGSGKTTALQAKLFCLCKLRTQKSTEGILVLSHTNAAVEEIKSKLSNACPGLFEYPNFVGTIQDFVDSFLTIPFYNKTYGHPITRIDSAVYRDEFKKAVINKRLWRDKVWTWYQLHNAEQSAKFGVRVFADGRSIPWDYSANKEFTVAATKYPKTWKGKVVQNRSHVLDILCQLKRQSYERGILSYDDCYVLAQMYINNSPRIRSIIRSRFKYIFIDETQDMQGHQLDIVDQLFNHESVCFQRIGDINQSIFHAGVDSTVCIWKPRNILTFNNSLRLSSYVATLVDAFMYRREDGQVVNGLRSVEPEIKPYLLIYDYEHRELLKPKFVELINHHNLNNISEKKYGFHIVGWNSKWTDDKVHVPDKLRLSDLYADFKSKDITTSVFADSIADYVCIAQHLKDNKQRCSFVDIVVCECLRLCNKFDTKIVNGNTRNRPYTPTSLHEYLKHEHADILKLYKLNVLTIVKKMVACNFEEVYRDLCDLSKWLKEVFGIEDTDDYNLFVGKPYIPVITLGQQHDPLIQIETIHRAKGQTHCATLYVETMYQGKYESVHVLNQIQKRATKRNPAVICSNPFYKESGIPQKSTYAQSAMKMAYVGLSRPTHLLCYAMHKSSFALYDEERLKACGWQIIDLTSE